MDTASFNTIAEVAPRDVWAELQRSSTAVLVDVRTKAEWAFVGVPDLSSLDQKVILAEWMIFPGMEVDSGFTDEVFAALGSAAVTSVFFICRSGVRSLAAARLFAQVAAENGLNVECINVAEGFEGDLNLESHRGEKNGWKAAGLPWRQS